ncbi:Cyclochlorotine biosynthesis protein R [Lasiodiplodia theobromae]|uniref:Cyclochlorotine biosynthesis protein R n=1 Tax=Lasiodiplodia theobromae TaxID=45133 RepID=A0A5N5CX91_9PEZI|nr:Cyclochlorotine biosynthesis protein R [Lasiodiplodia theobromae]
MAIFAASLYLFRASSPREPLPDSVAKAEELPTEFIKFNWHTPWSSNNDSEADQLWDNINTAHGHIAVDRDWASTQNWPPSMDVPGQPGKAMYLLEAYHQLHCLRLIRRTLLDLYHGTPPQWPIAHNRHCFDALRQHIMCHADSTPLYGVGDHMAGNEQVHSCKSWTALRDYATANTACFHDGQPGWTLEDHFSQCDDGTDGL